MRGLANKYPDLSASELGSLASECDNTMQTHAGMTPHLRMFGTEARSPALSSFDLTAEQAVGLAEGSAASGENPIQARSRISARLATRQDARAIWLQESVCSNMARGMLRKTRNQTFKFVEGKRCFYWVEKANSKGYWVPATLRHWWPERKLVVMVNDQNATVKRPPEFVCQFVGKMGSADYELGREELSGRE